MPRNVAELRGEILVDKEDVHSVSEGGIDRCMKLTNPPLFFNIELCSSTYLVSS